MDDLRYGAIGVNVWHALAFAMGSTTWGAYPGHSRTDIESGTGVVGNAAMFDRPQKSVVRGPFRSQAEAPLVRDRWRFLRRHAAFRGVRSRPVHRQGPGAARRRGTSLSLNRTGAPHSEAPTPER